MKKLYQVLGLIAFLLTLGVPGIAVIHNAQASESNLQIVESFNKGGNDKNPNDPSDKRKRAIMFIMGVPLLIMLISTAILGIAMGVFGKKVFVAHMVLASLSLCLAIAHAIVGLVWFYPF